MPEVKVKSPRDPVLFWMSLSLLDEETAGAVKIPAWPLNYRPQSLKKCWPHKK